MAPTLLGGEPFGLGAPGPPCRLSAPQPISPLEVGAGPPAGWRPPEATRACHITRQSVMAGGVGSGAPGLRSLAQPLRKTGSFPTLAEQSGWLGPADDHQSAALSYSTAR